MIGKYNEKCDLWSTGVLVYYMLTGEFPFDDETDEGLEYKIKT
jgi:calcium-dependent protein kinase